MRPIGARMTQSIRWWKVEDGSRLAEVPSSRLDFEDRLEDWLERDIAVLREDLLVIGRQVPTAFGGTIDLLCLDTDGNTVVVELKRDKTPREITAQTLDYASWVRDLPAARIIEIANTYLGHRGPIETVFRERFGNEIPEELNSSHSMMVVAAHVDAASERIIQYLSRVYGVPINACTFDYFLDSEGREFMARVFLMEPEAVERRASTAGTSKRAPPLTPEQLEELANGRGLGDIWRGLVALFEPMFPASGTTPQALRFFDGFEDTRRAVFMSLFPGDKSDATGIKFQIYARRFATRFGTTEEQIQRALPPASAPWIYQKGASADYTGFAGTFHSVEEAARLTRVLISPTVSMSAPKR